MTDEISKKIAELPRLQTRQLRGVWQELFAKTPHPKLRRELMIPILAYQIQENAYGGLKPSTRKRSAKTCAMRFARLARRSQAGPGARR